ncbi:pre-peptidase [Oculatella sp. LEGE 06141]|uniref:pre-peptidase n=1 Tax=Oculatella sp. LEGE 06141 TaxID=1828648 RepID=UPI00188115D6|nr:pre-peptidase [Oculatella sp. LEGE 06141]MBE9179130.1 pre-peptidase [Oculatella sp. LEGE 06141]
MSKRLISRLRLPFVVSATVCALGFSAATVSAQESVAQQPPTQRSSTPMYNPMPMPAANEVTDTLSEKDIPTGFGGFARDYLTTFNEGDHVVIDLISDEFDTIITLIAPDGSTLGENDDGPDGTTNSLLFARITRPGSYILRVRPYAGQGLGTFNLKVTRLRPVDE